MGLSIGKPDDRALLPSNLETLTQVNSTKKRKHDNGKSMADEANGPSRPKKRHHATSDYIYSTLFVDGEGSDLTITALDSSWKLHKVYLCQSPYFRSMLKGNWLESKQSEINIVIPDERIDKKALDLALGSLYSDNINQQALLDHIIPTTAAACMLQLEGLMQQCEDAMQKEMSPDNVCQYHQVAVCYSLTDLEARCFSWLETNLLRYKTSSVYLIKKDLLEKVLTSPNLFTMQVEMDIYNFIKMWVYLQIHPQRIEHSKKISEMQKYFRNRRLTDGTTIPFLRTEDGLRFASVFRCLRLQHLLVDPKAITLVEQDCILPKEWLLPLYKEQWKQMLAVFNSSDLGPINVDEAFFDVNSCRCGRVLPKKASYCWRWTGFSYGVDLIISYDHKDHGMVIKRNAYSQPCNSALCMQKERVIAFRIKAFSLTESGIVTNYIDSELVEIPMKFDEQITFLELDNTWTFPVYVSARFMLVSPNRTDENDDGIQRQGEQQPT